MAGQSTGVGVKDTVFVIAVGICAMMGTVLGEINVGGKGIYATTQLTRNG